MKDASVEVLKDLKKEFTSAGIPCTMTKYYDTTSFMGYKFRLLVKILTLHIGIYIADGEVRIVPHGIDTISKADKYVLLISDPQYLEKSIKYLKKVIKTYCKAATKFCKEITDGMC